MFRCVMLNAVKHLARPAEILRFAQNDVRAVNSLLSSRELPTAPVIRER